MCLDIEKTKEFIDLLHPYMKWLILIMYGCMFLYVNRVFIKDPILRKWIIASFEEQEGRASGKAITSFVFAKLTAFATLTAIVYAPNHILPEFFLISLLTFIASLYGIKMASKYFTGGDTTQSQTTTVKPTVKPDVPVQEVVVDNKDQPKEENINQNPNQPNPNDLG